MADKDIGYPSDAYHDPKSGMFVKPEHQDGTDKEFLEIATASGRPIFLPKPRLKPVRKLQFAVPHAFLEVVESMERCKEFVTAAKQDDAPEWFAFVEPVYGNALYVHRDKLRDVCWIMEGFTDLDAFELQMAQADHMKNVARMQGLSQKKLG